MATNPGIAIQFFGDRELRDKVFTRPGTVVPSFVPPIIGFHEERLIEDDGGVIQGPDQRVNTQPARVSGPSNKGILLEGFYDLFWKNRVHILPIPIAPTGADTDYDQFNAGNIVTAVERDFEIYNAGEGPRYAIILGTFAQDPGSQGVTMLTGAVSPFVLGAGESELYSYRIETIGTPVVDTNLVFTFTDDFAQVLIHNLTASRVAAITLRPQSKIDENWSWVTDIITSKSGREQRNAMRPIPQQILTYTYMFDDSVNDFNARIENLLWNNEREFAIPLWIDETTLSSPITPGDSVVNVVSTTNRDFRSGLTEAFIVYDTPDNFEVQGTSAFGATSITANSVFLNAWPVGTRVYPLRFSRVVMPASQRAWAINAREIKVSWRPTTNVDFSSEAGFPLYRTLPIWEEDWLVPSMPMSLQWSRQQDIFNSRTGLFHQSSLKDFPAIQTAQLFELPDRAEFWRIKRWLFARRGMQRVFWMSTRRPDLVVSADTGISTNLDVVNVGYASNVFPNDRLQRRVDLEITYADGAINYRRVTSATDNGATERLVLDSASSQTLSPANVSRVSYLKAWRLNTDQLEFKHEWKSRGTIVVPIIEATYE